MRKESESVAKAISSGKTRIKAAFPIQSSLDKTDIYDLTVEGRGINGWSALASMMMLYQSR